MSHPSGDKRFKILETTMKKHQLLPGALIEVLHAAQELFGYLELDLLYFIARGMKLPPSKVYGVATFYHFFSLKPKGEHTCVVCTGTACYVKGAGELPRAVAEAAHVKEGETTANGKLSLLTARCLGACGMAPAVVLDGSMKGHATPDNLLQQVQGWLAGGPARSA
ncbi:MAG: bidirectional hydrogenase complex protein HoxE [Planctomycetes bacterium]|nr:bidirectional hydrogenase complex protein HoxE [Planctomycetota bacterium]